MLFKHGDSIIKVKTINKDLYLLGISRKDN